MKAVGSTGMREGQTYAVMLAPALLALTLLVAVPLVYLVYTSLLEWKLTDPLGKTTNKIYDALYEDPQVIRE